MIAFRHLYDIGVHSRDAPRSQFLARTLGSITLTLGKGHHMSPHHFKWLCRGAFCVILAAGSTALGQDDGPPTAVAGVDQSIHAGQMVYLDGSDSFDDNTPSASLYYWWAFVSVPPSSNALLADPYAATTSFVADVPGTYVVDLVVYDETEQASEPDELIVSSFNLPPTVRASASRGVVVGTLAHGYGFGWDPEGDPLTYQWTLVDKPLGSASTLSNDTSPNCDLTPDLPGEYTLELVAHDGFSPSVPHQAVCIAISGQDAVENLLLSWINIVNTWPWQPATNEGNRTAFINLLTQVIQALHSDNLTLARTKLVVGMERTDGIYLRGEPDATGPGRDWIIDWDVSYWLYSDLVWSLDAISP